MSGFFCQPQLHRHLRHNRSWTSSVRCCGARSLHEVGDLKGRVGTQNRVMYANIARLSKSLIGDWSLGSKLRPMIHPEAIYANLQMWLWFNVFSTSRDLILNSVTCQSF